MKSAQGYPAKATEKLQEYQDIVNQHDEQQTREPSSTEGLIKQPLPISNKFNDVKKRLLMPQEEVEALSEPSIMDKYIKQNDPEQYDKIQLAKNLKWAQESGPGFAAGMNIVGKTAKLAAVPVKIAQEVAPVAEVSSIPKTTLAEKDPEAMARWNKMMREEVDPNYSPENDPSFLNHNAPTYTQDYKSMLENKIPLSSQLDDEDKFSQLKKYLGQ